MGDCDGPGVGDSVVLILSGGRKDWRRLFLATVLVSLLEMASSSWLMSSRFSSWTASMLGDMTVSSIEFMTLSSIKVLSSRMLVRSKTFLDIGAAAFGDGGTSS